MRAAAARIPRAPARHEPTAGPRTRGRVGLSIAYGASSVIGPTTAISQSGDPKIKLKYTPESGDKSSKIVFVQVLRSLLDGTASKPSALHASFKFRDPDTTKDFFYVDYTDGEKDPYYNGDDPGDKWAGQVQGDATAKPQVAAEMNDTPDYQDGHFPSGKTKLKHEFRTYAFSAAGADKGTFYAYAKWTFSKEKGKASSLSHDGEAGGGPVAEDKAAIDLWCTNHGFTLPK